MTKEYFRINTQRAAPNKLFDKLVLTTDMHLLKLFMIVITVFSVLSTLFAAYFACFGEPATPGIKAFEIVMEVFFALDIIRNFLMQYTEPTEPKKPIRVCSKIASHYVKTSFVYDMVALSATPLIILFTGVWTPDNVSLFFLLRLLRLSKIVIIMDKSAFISVVRHHYKKKLQKVVLPGENGAKEYDKDDHTVDNNKIML